MLKYKARSEKTKTYAFVLDIDESKKLEEIAYEQRLSFSELLREGVDKVIAAYQVEKVA